MTSSELQDLLEMDCPNCKGKGEWGHPHKDGHMVRFNCDTCGRRGKVLTSPGEYLMELIRHHMQDERQESYQGPHGFCGELASAIRSCVKDGM